MRAIDIRVRGDGAPRVYTPIAALALIQDAVTTQTIAHTLATEAHIILQDDVKPADPQMEGNEIRTVQFVSGITFE